MKEITKEELYALLENGVVRNTRKGIVNANGESTGFYKTRRKRYIEDQFADIAKRIIKKK